MADTINHSENTEGNRPETIKAIEFMTNEACQIISERGQRASNDLSSGINAQNEIVANTNTAFVPLKSDIDRIMPKISPQLEQTVKAPLGFIGQQSSNRDILAIGINAENKGKLKETVDKWILSIAGDTKDHPNSIA